MSKGAVPWLAIVVVGGIVFTLSLILLGNSLKSSVTLETATEQVDLINLKYGIDEEKILLDNMIWVLNENSTYSNLIRSMFSQQSYNNADKRGGIPFWRRGDSITMPSKDEVLNDVYGPVAEGVVSNSFLFHRLSNIDITFDTSGGRSRGDSTVTAEFDVGVEHESRRITAEIFGEDEITNDYIDGHLYVYDNAADLTRSFDELMARALEESVTSLGGDYTNPRCGSPPEEIPPELLREAIEYYLTQEIGSEYPDDLEIAVEVVEADYETEVIIDGACGPDE